MPSLNQKPHNFAITNYSIRLPFPLHDYIQCKIRVSETHITIQLFKSMVDTHYNSVISSKGFSIIRYANRLKLKSYRIDSFDDDVIKIAIERL